MFDVQCTHSLLVHEKRGEQRPDIGKSRCKTFIESGTNGAATHLIQRVAVPPVIHIGFPETECPGSKDSTKEVLVMRLYVPGACAVDADVGEFKTVRHDILGFRHMIWPVAGALRSCLKNRVRSGDWFEWDEGHRKAKMGGRNRVAAKRLTFHAPLNC